MRRTSILALLLLAVTPLFAQGGKPNHASQGQASQTQISVSATGLNCSNGGAPGTFNVLAWSFGASNSGAIVGGGGGGAGKANVQDLSLSKLFDSCSPKIFEQVVKGTHFQKLVLTQSDGKDIVMVVTLSDVITTSYSIGSSADASVPNENVTFGFAKIEILEPKSGARIGWDVAQNKSF